MVKNSIAITSILFFLVYSTGCSVKHDLQMEYFVTAAETGDIETLTYLLKTGIDINAESEQGMTALHHAIIGKRLESVQFLLVHGIDINKNTSPGGVSSLEMACDTGNLPIAKLLIDKGINVNHIGFGGWTPLIRATAYGNIELKNPLIVKLLLERGAKPSSKTKEIVEELKAERIKLKELQTPPSRK